MSLWETETFVQELLAVEKSLKWEGAILFLQERPAVGKEQESSSHNISFDMKGGDAVLNCSSAKFCPADCKFSLILNLKQGLNTDDWPWFPI